MEKPKQPQPDYVPDPEAWVNMRRGQSVTVKSSRGDTVALFIALVPARLALAFMRAATDVDPQTALEIACGYDKQPGALDWLENSEVPRLLKLACELNFEGCAEAADSQGAALERFLPVLRKHLETAKQMIEKELSASMKGWIESQISAFAPPSSSKPAPKSSGKRRSR